MWRFQNDLHTSPNSVLKQGLSPNTVNIYMYIVPNAKVNVPSVVVMV